IAELSLFGSLPLIAKVKDLKEPKQPDRFILGGDDYFLKVVVTTKGAGVQQVTFNERLTGFLAADSLGRPTDRPLSLVEDDPYYPSYLMYHYPKGYAAEPDKEGAKTPPSPALAEAVWQVEGQPTPDEIRLTAAGLLPDYPHLRITKIYHLGRKDYHVGL